MAGGFRHCGPAHDGFGPHPADRGALPRGPMGIEPDPFARHEHEPDVCDDFDHWHGFRYPEHDFWDSLTGRLERWRDRMGDRIASAVASLTLRTEAARIAREELAYWTDNRLTERRRAGQTRIQRYWRIGVRRSVTRHTARREAWSAAFIDFVMRQAGAGDSFRYAWKHVTYVKAAIDNLQQNRPNSFKAYKIDDPRATPDKGDLVCNWRKTRRTYDEIAAMRRAYGYTHCDLVVDKDAGGRKIQLIGGNKTGGVVAQVEIDLDENGLIVDQPRGFYIAVLKHS